MTPLFARTSTILLATLATILLFATPAGANSILGLSTSSSDVLSLVEYKTRGLALLAVIVLETLVFWRLLPTSLLKALLLSILLNIISTIVGFLADILVHRILLTLTFIVPTALIGVFGFALILYALIAVARARKVPVWATATLIVCLTLGLFSLALYKVPDNLFGAPGLYIGLALVILAGFGLTLFVEGVALTFTSHGKNLWKAVLVANLLSYILLAAASYYYAPEEGWYVPRGRTEGIISRCRGMLLSIGAAQRAYRNEHGVYGSFQDLQDMGVFAQDYTLDNMTEHHTLTWDVDYISTVPSNVFPRGTISTFTVVALPKAPYRLYLSTFAITEDHVVRVYNPDAENDLNAVHTWDPIL